VYTVTWYRPARGVTLEAANSVLWSQDTITVAPDGGGATVCYEASVRLRGLLRPFDPLLAVTFPKVARRAAAGLADRLRGGP